VRTDSAEKAVVLLREKSFGAMIIDHLMPGMDGLQLVGIVRNSIKSKIPILLMTLLGKEIEKHEAEKAGIDALVTKPVFPKDLFSALSAVFGFIERVPLTPMQQDREIREKIRFENLRILVAEDNLTNQEIIQAILSGVGIHTEIVADGEKAVEVVQLRPFDAILMDIQMPEMDGYEATRRIRKTASKNGLPPNPDRLPIIAMTAYALKGDREKCLDAGMDDYLTKPIRQKELYDTLCRHLQIPENNCHNPNMNTCHMPQVSIPETMPGIDIPEALERLCIARNDFRNILLRFGDRARSEESRAREAYSQKKYVDLQRIAHSMKGSAGNIGAFQLEEAARNLEVASMDKLPEAESLDLFVESLNEVIASIDLLAKASGGMSEFKAEFQPEFEQESEIGPETKKELLALLKSALKEWDPVAIDDRLRNLERHFSPDDITHIREKIDAYEYDVAMEYLVVLSGKVESK